MNVKRMHGSFTGATGAPFMLGVGPRQSRLPASQRAPPMATEIATRIRRALFVHSLVRVSIFVGDHYFMLMSNDVED